MARGTRVTKNSKKGENMLGVVTGKAIYKLEKALHFGGTTMPGRVVLKFFPKTMKSLKYPENVIMVTGSCGKGSTTKLITEVLERAGMKVCCNRDGANQWEGVATTIMNQTKGDQEATCAYARPKQSQETGHKIPEA